MQPISKQSIIYCVSNGELSDKNCQLCLVGEIHVTITHLKSFLNDTLFRIFFDSCSYATTTILFIPFCCLPLKMYRFNIRLCILHTRYNIKLNKSKNTTLLLFSVFFGRKFFVSLVFGHCHSTCLAIYGTTHPNTTDFFSVRSFFVRICAIVVVVIYFFFVFECLSLAVFPNAAQYANAETTA